jgi:hypothetical protein
MAEVTQEELIEEAEKVLRHNSRGDFTVPAGDLYPHQWLWDSCFIAIGLRHLDVKPCKSRTNQFAARAVEQRHVSKHYFF